MSRVEVSANILIFRLLRVNLSSESDSLENGATPPTVQVLAFVRERAGVCVCVVFFIMFHCGFFV